MPVIWFRYDAKGRDKDIFRRLVAIARAFLVAEQVSVLLVPILPSLRRACATLRIVPLRDGGLTDVRPHFALFVAHQLGDGGAAGLG
jgi:hypothetical protein